MEINNRKNKQGVVFSLDAAIAVTVIIIILINSAYYFSTSSKESLSQLQPVRVGGDIMAILDYTGSFDDAIVNDPVGSSFLDVTRLNYTQYLPANYEIKVSVNDLQESVANNSVLDDPSGYCKEYCSIPPGGTIYVNFTTLPIQTEDNYYLIVKTNISSLPLGTTTVSTLKAVKEDRNGVERNYKTVLPYYDIPGAYILASPLPLYFTAGNNSFRLENEYTAPVGIEWFRVLGDDAYALANDEILPNNRFVGSGERVVTAKQGDIFYGFHNVRYWIWLKSTP